MKLPSLKPNAARTGADALPQGAQKRTIAPSRAATIGSPLFIFVFLSLGIGTLGYAYFRHETRATRESAQVTISAIADLKMRQILAWRQNLLGDARMIMEELPLRRDLQQFLAQQVPSAARAEMRSWLKAVCEHNEGLRILLLDEGMNVRLAYPADKAYFGPMAQSYAVRALQSNDVVMSDLHHSQFSGEIHLDLAFPVRGKPELRRAGTLPAGVASLQPLGVIVIEVDPEKFLYPQIRNWPTPSPTGETLLVRLERDAVVFLSELREKKSAALSLRLPASSPQVAAQAVQEGAGMVEGFDYRGKPVLAAARGVPGTAWFVVAKVDQEEIYAPLRERGLTVAIFALVLIVVAALSVGLLGHRRETHMLRNQLAFEQTHRLILDCTDQGVLGLDSQGRHVFANPAACRMLGYDPDELIGQSGYASWHNKKADGTPYPFQHCPIHKALNAGTSCSADDDVFWRKDGSNFLVEYVATPSREEDRQIALVLFFRDITGRKQAEALREQYTIALESEKMAMEEFYEAAESMTRAKSEFLANMSHEIRTPMTAILGYADLLAAELHDPEHLESLGIIRSNGDHLLTIINDILDLSKIEAGKLQIDRQPCSPAAIAAEVISLLRVRASGKGLSLKLEFDGPLPEAISTDPIRLRQILLNLVGNAIKFTETGEVRVVVRLAHRHGSKPELVCEVIDTGIGMTAAQIENLFQPFQQAEASTSRTFGGTGLGLAIAKRLAEMLGGAIAVASQPARGSTFVLTVDPGPLDGTALLDQPGDAIAAAKANPALTNRQPRLNCRILLAEDGVDNRRFISFLLSKAGARVTGVENGQKALEMALATFHGWGRRQDDPHETFDVILMDMQMPVMDGYTATRRLRNEGYIGPIIALTAHAMADDRQKCLDAGCDDYATKPIEPVKLMSTITQAIEKSSHRAAGCVGAAAPGAEAVRCAIGDSFS
jgi:PAS domain S-box-containing protein